jgi:hypothetical protein
MSAEKNRFDGEWFTTGLFGWKRFRLESSAGASGNLHAVVCEQSKPAAQAWDFMATLACAAVFKPAHG